MEVNDAVNYALTNGLTYEQLIAYIDGLHADGNLTDEDYNKIILYILANGNVENSPRDLIQLRRGNQAQLPNLAQGEPAFTLDTNELYVGGVNGNQLINPPDLLDGKHVLILGDSISSPDTNPPNWTTLMARRHPKTRFTNLSYGGAKISGENGLAALTATLTNVYDYIILFAGINDRYYGTPIGSFYTIPYPLTTFTGSLNMINFNLKQKCPAANVFVVTPLKSNAIPANPVAPIDCYRTALISFAQEYGYNIIDATSFAPLLHPTDEFNKSQWMPDGTHPVAAYWPIFERWMWNIINGSGSTPIANNKIKLNLETWIDDQAATNKYMWFTLDTYSNITLDLRYMATVTAGLNKIASIPEWARPDTNIFAKCNISAGGTGSITYAAITTDLAVYIQMPAGAADFYIHANWATSQNYFLPVSPWTKL